MRLFSRGNTGESEYDGDYAHDNSIGVSVGSLKARKQMLLLNPEAGWMNQPINPYLAPTDLYLFWGDSTEPGTLASGFSGGRGRTSSGERIRQILKFGTFTGNGYVDDATGHGKFLRSWEGLRFQSMAIKCCSTLLVPPMERNLPIAADQSQFARRIRSYVANGNQLIMIGGDYSTLVFINRYFHFELKKTVYDAGPFEKLPEKQLPENCKEAFEDMPETLPQSGLSVTTVTKQSLPPGAKLIYATPVSSPVFELTYCESIMDKDSCDTVKPMGKSCAVDVLPQDCPALEKLGRPCSCGTIMYVGYDYVEHHSHTIGRSVWDKILRAAVATKKLGKPGLGDMTSYT
mmetsp:Transcript_19228/g.30039  ORF Transcript_19228/g.30039 Transcript_19228/m.30039 type:complete len:346 (+) Transcript_19228:235-1272(+)